MRVFVRSYLYESTVISLYKAENDIKIRPNCNIVFKFSTGQAQSSLDEGLVAYWKFDNSYVDSSPFMNNGTAQGGAAFTTDRNGVVAGALLLNGLDAYVEIPNSASLSSPTDQGSITAWIRIDDWYVNSFGKYFFFCEKSESKFNYQYTTAITEEVIDPAEPSFLITSYTTSEAFSARVDAPEISLGEWVCATVTWNDAATVNFYVGDALIGQSNDELNVRPNNGNVEIGRSTGGELEFSQGAVDDLRIYNRALSQIEVADVCKENTTSAAVFDTQSRFAIFPNPALDYFSVVSSDRKILGVDVYTATGQLIEVSLTPIQDGFSVSSDYRGLAILHIRTALGIKAERMLLR